MASSIYVKDVLYRVSAQLHDVSPQFTRWTQKELVYWLNDGQKAIAKYMPSSCARVDAVKLKSGTKQSIEKILSTEVLPGDGSTPTDVYGNHLQAVIRNMGSNGSTPGNSIRVIDREVLDANSPDWHTKTSTSIAAFTFDPRYPKIFYVTPGVPVAGLWVEVSYLADPVTVSTSGDYGSGSNDTTKISVDDMYVDDLVNYILARAYMKDAEFAANGNLAQAHSQMFVSSINAQVAARTGVNPNLQSLPLNPMTAAVPMPRNAG